MTVDLLPWAERPMSVAAMFNPALTASCLAAAADQYEVTTGKAMPWALGFLVVPLVLHTPTRQELPRRSNASLGKWVADHPVLMAGYAARAKRSAPYVREGVQFGLREGSFAWVENDRLHATLPPTTKPSVLGDLGDIVRKSGMLGRVFGNTGSTYTVFATLRVRP